MKTINEIIYSEFEQGGYHRVSEKGGYVLYASNEGFDYWLICNSPEVINRQSELYDTIVKESPNCSFMEKNLTLLILMDKEGNVDIPDPVKVENDKSYFKKYILYYDQSSVVSLNLIIDNEGVTGLTDLLLSERYFNEIKNDSTTLNGVSLMYAIAHKLPFMQIKSVHKERKDVSIHLSSPELSDLLRWVEACPEGDRMMMDYINQSISI